MATYLSTWIQKMTLGMLRLLYRSVSSNINVYLISCAHQSYGEIDLLLACLLTSRVSRNG